MNVDFAAALDFIICEVDSALQVVQGGRGVVDGGQLQMSLPADSLCQIAAFAAHIDDGADAIVAHFPPAARKVLPADMQLWRNRAEPPNGRAGDAPGELVDDAQGQGQRTGAQQTAQANQRMRRGLGNCHGVQYSTGGRGSRISQAARFYARLAGLFAANKDMPCRR